jgi:NitT/TauT family transport system substrate-binding protein
MRIAPPKLVTRSLAAVALVLAVTACGDQSESSADAASGGGAAEEMRLGYFANVTHAAALIGVQNGAIADELGTGTTLTTQVFNAGPDEVEALFAGAIDAAYIGPSPTINAYGQRAAMPSGSSPAPHPVARSSSSGTASTPPPT